MEPDSSTEEPAKIEILVGAPTGTEYARTITGCDVCTLGKRRVMAPLFTSYVFICGTELDRYTTLTTNRLYQMIEVSDQDGLVRELSR